MKRATQYRHLGQKETQIARLVFKSTIKYHRVTVSNGLGADDRPYTVPTSLRIPFVSNVADGDFVIHVGDGYFGLISTQSERALLIHELTHVWQGYHGGSSYDYVLGSVWHQALADDAYSYDRRNLKEWDDYGPEQQASIVEDWYLAGMKHDKAQDLRFYYIKKHIWGERVDYNWLNDQWAIKPLEVGHLPAEMYAPQYPPTDAMVLKLLRQRFQADDVAGYSKRFNGIAEIFEQTTRRRAAQYVERLSTRIAGDELSELFKDRLSTAGREKLLRILRRRATN